MPAIAGTSRFRSCWFPCRIAPPPTRNSSGSTKLKNAALGLRQNMLPLQSVLPPSERQGVSVIEAVSSRYTSSSVGRPTLSSSSCSPLAERLAGELVQQPRRVLGLALDQLAVAIAVGDPILRGAGRVGSEFARRPDREHAPVLDDRHAVGQRLGLVEVVGRQQDRLPAFAQVSHRLPGVACAPRGRTRWSARPGRSAPGRPPARARNPASAAARPRACGCARRPSPAGPARCEHLIDIARARVEARPVSQRLARGYVAVDAARLQHDPDPLSQSIGCACRDRARARDTSPPLRSR